MERIQSALNKARKTRSGNSQDRRPDRTKQNKGTITADVPDGLAEAWAGLRPLNTSPKLLKRSRIETFETSKMSGHFDLLRTKVLQQMRANNWRRLAITSPGASCGKTTTCANLAFSLARQSDTRTVIAEIDLRRPAMAGVLGLDKDNTQFSRALDGREPLQDHMLRYGENLAFGLNHHPAKNPSELLQSDTLAEQLRSLEETYDPHVVIFDMPPMLVTDDMLGFLDQVDCVLLVAAAEKTTVDEVDLCERELASHTNMLGVVLNKCRYMTKGYGYGYYD